MHSVLAALAFASAKAIKGGNLSEEGAENEIRFSEEYRQAIEKIIHLDGMELQH